MSKKYVIDLPDDAQYILINGASENHCYTRVDQVEDLEELNSDYINEHFGELQDEAYQRGINDGSLDVKQRVEGAYQRGLEDAWEAARKIALMDTETSENVTGYFGLFRIMENLTPMQAIEKLKAYEDKHSDRIEVGDEVRTRDGAPSHTFLVTKVTDSHVYGISNDGSWNYWTKDEVTKTGKHYDIQSILEAMRK
jgi:hypothetical protein